MPLILALIILLGGGTTSLLANNSLPGDVLYPIKINVNEKVESMLAVTEKGDAEVDASQASRRLKEAEALAAKGKLDKKLNEKIKDSFTKEISSLDAHIVSLENAGATTTAIKLRGEWKDELDNHYKAFLLISGTSTTTGTIASSSPLFDLFYVIKKEKNSDDEGEKNKEEKKTEIKRESESKNEIKSNDSEEMDNEDDNENEDDDNGNGATQNTSVQSTTTVNPILKVSLQSYTMSQVALHNTSASCYSVVSGNVYDLTTWISQHPGGKTAITGMCGVDATSAFINQHGGQSNPEKELVSLKIGVLVK